jgi:putative SOS response-associated peptidase YedK
MCYYNGRRVTRQEYDELKSLEVVLAHLSEDLVIYKGFDYNDISVIRPIAGTHETERVKMQWGFLPNGLKTKEDVNKFRKGYKDERGIFHKPFTTLNATSEELLTKMYKDAAKNRRCLVPSKGFYEWRHVMFVGKSGKLL